LGERALGRRFAPRIAFAIFVGHVSENSNR
jgi:hypothetical protein